MVPKNTIMFKYLLSAICLFSSVVLFSQDIAIGEWKEYLSYQKGLSVSEGNGKVYCASAGGLFFYNKNDNSLERLSKVNGLSDVEPVVLNYNNYDNKLLVAYKNSNIDIIQGNTITNISDIKRKSIVGNKAINNIYFINQYAYLACGFGIVVVDMDKLEIKDTYYIGPNGSYINVYDITSDGTYIYASTESGIYKALLSSSNLANYVNWNKMPGLPNGVYNSIANFNGKIVTSYSKFIATGTYYQDTLYYYDTGLNLWTKFPGLNGIQVKKIYPQNNSLLVTFLGSYIIFDQNYNITSQVINYPFGASSPSAAIMEQNNTIWVADEKYGLVSKNTSGNFNYIYPNGPGINSIYGMHFKEGNLWVAPGGKDNTWWTEGVFWNNNGNWTNIKGDYPGIVNIDTIYNIINVCIDPNDPKRVYAASWYNGIIEFYNGVPVKHYTHLNSSLQMIANPSPTFRPVWIYGMAVDQDGIFWASNTYVTLSLSAKSPNGSWKAFDFSPFVGNTPNMGQILIDKNNQKWIVIDKSGGLMIYKGGFNDSPNSTNTKKLTTTKGNGALPSAAVYAIAEDQDGEIWIGTDKGIAVFYSPENIFSSTNFDAQQILIEQDGHVQILLETEQVQAIAVDDANRKWIGTQNSGAFLVSPDGTELLAHFDESNSPLFSNNIKKIEINRETGEIFFGTEKGLISYRGTAIAGNEYFDSVMAFPNPVRPDYAGPIAIKGLVTNTTVKITDISGTLVYETKSEGGQAIWYGKNFNGEKVSSGVYMVFCTNEDGSQKIATKILFIN